MKCPKCGEEIKEGFLYCEKCGEDIHIVPDFEPELEQNIEQNLKAVFREIAPPAKQTAVPRDSEQIDKVRSGRRKVIAGWGILLFFVVTVIVVGGKVFQYYSLEYQLQQATKATSLTRYEDAIRYYERAMELAPMDMEIKLDLAQVYFLKNDKESYEYWLRSIADDPRIDPEQLESIYGKLIAIYKAKEDYQAINDMLRDCPVESIKSAYQIYIAEMPQFSVPSGEYDEVKALKLTAVGKGKIYYTMDGQTPDATKTQYVSPILMENGDYTIRAVFINENGVQSPIADAWYEIQATELEAPALNLDGGEYDLPVMITVTNDPQNVYYTTDGTTPTKNSMKYTEPIPLPLGISHFCFARLEELNSSALVERTFIFVLQTDLTPETAVKLVRENLLKNGRIYDENGHFDEESGARYLLQYLYVTEWEQDTVFMIEEVLADERGGLARTGNYYMVNAYNGEVETVVME